MNLITMHLITYTDKITFGYIFDIKLCVCVYIYTHTIVLVTYIMSKIQ